jgi:carboxymethylenebutenolidase
MVEREVEIETPDGRMPAFRCAPDGAPRPAVIMLMDAGGMREELRELARGVARRGWCVLLPNLYYRGGVTLHTPEVDVEGSAAQKRILSLYTAFSNEMALRDAGAALDFLARDPAVAPGPAGCLGFCMSGPFALAAAGAFPGRIAAAASLHGVKLATDAPDSPHRLAGRMRAELYVGWAENDPFAPLDQLPVLREALERAKLRFEIEVHPGTQHGFMFPRRAWHDAVAAARVWEKLAALFARCLAR